MPTRRSLLLVAFPLLSQASGAFALDAPTVELVTQGFGKAVLHVTAGSSGAPNGFSVWWMKAEDYAFTGWIYSPTTTQGVASFTGIPTLNTFGGSISSFVLDPNQTVTVEIGDLEDETGVWSNSLLELVPGTPYVFCVSANDQTGGWYPASTYSDNENAFTLGGQDCTYTQGYWKNHPENWPVSSLTIGTVSYTDTQLLSIFQQPVQGNGLVSLSRQLIATKLNIANGSDPSAVESAVDDVDALIGGLVVPPAGGGNIQPQDTSSLTQTLDNYNNGIIGPGHCPPVPVQDASWGSVKGLYR